MASKLDAALKLTLMIAALTASASVSYYFLVYLPARDVKLELESKKEQARSEIARRVEQQRVETALKEQRDRAQAEHERQEEEKIAIQTRYSRCRAGAFDNYSKLWASSCKSIADKRAKERAGCLSKGATPRETCELLYAPTDQSETCSLPRQLGQDFENTLERERDRCLQESKAGFR